ncbi:hypothetical protein NFI96_019626, partial [Prochilodus magdalenae]
CLVSLLLSQLAQRRASQFRTLLTERRRSNSSSESESSEAKTEVIQTKSGRRSSGKSKDDAQADDGFMFQVSSDYSDESGQISNAGSERASPAKSLGIDQPDVQDLSEVLEEDATATSVEEQIGFTDDLSDDSEAESAEDTETEKPQTEEMAHSLVPVITILRKQSEHQDPPDTVETAAASEASPGPGQDLSMDHPHPNTAGQPGDIRTLLGHAFQMEAPKKLAQMTAESETARQSKKGGTEHQKLKQPLSVSPVDTEDLKEFLQSLGFDHVEDLAFTVQDEPLTEAQTDAFRTVFACFDKNSGSCIDVEALRSTLASVGISITSGEAEAALKRADSDGDGVVGFHDFLSVMTDCQQFSRCVKEEADRADGSGAVFFNALAKLLNAGILPGTATTEIVRYYHKKTLHLIRHTAHLHDGGGQVLTYYSKGAHLLGLSSKQLRKYLKPLEKSSIRESPYLMCPSLKVGLTHTHMPVHHGTLAQMGRVKTARTWKTLETEDRTPEVELQCLDASVLQIPLPEICKIMYYHRRVMCVVIFQLSIKHPGMQTKQMITPVQIKVNLTLKERDHLTFDQIEQIVSKSQAGLNQYLKTLARYKRRDSWNSWGSLQSYCRLHRCKHFPQTFSTYSWSWTACRNMMEVSELMAGFGEVCLTAKRPRGPEKNGS